MEYEGTEVMAQAQQPWLSIVIPSYNYARYLGKCVGSILAQGMDDIEVIVVDDCSTDDSLAVARQLAAVDSRVQVLANEQNEGGERSLLSGLERVRGRFVSFTAADNYFFPGYLPFARNYLDTHPGTDVFYSSWMFVDEQDRIYRAHSGSHGSATIKPSQLRNIAAYDDRNELADLFVNNMYLGDPIFRAGLLSLGGWSGNPDASAVSDLEFAINLASSDARIAFVNISAGIDRFHKNNLRFRREGLVAQEALFRGILYLFERYINESVADKLRYRIDDIIARANELIGHYKTVPEIWAQLGTRAERVIEHLSTTLTKIAQTPRTDPVKWRRVSVIVPVRGADLILLAEALTSIAEQDYDDWEIVAVGHPAIDLKPFLKTLPFAGRIRYYEQCEWINRATARNVGLKMARGQIMTYLDEGNIMRPGHLAGLVAALDHSRQPVARTSGTLSLYERTPLEGNVAKQFYSEPILISSEPFKSEIAAWSTHIWDNVPLNSIAHQRNCVAIAGYFDEDLDLYEDWDFVVRLTRQFNMALRADQSLDMRVIVDDIPNAMFAKKTSSRTELERLYRVYSVETVPEVASQRAAVLERWPQFGADIERATGAERASLVRLISGLS
jgi:glycosyltransferase involved in cell wall biosynthesis